MGEVEPLVDNLEQATTYELVDAPRCVVLAQIGRALDQFEFELTANDGRHGEQSLLALAETVEPGRDESSDALWQRRRSVPCETD